MSDRPKFEEIDVERINIVESDGTRRMTISNNARFPDPLLEGTSLDRAGQRGAGLLFLNEEGFECGGLVYAGREREGTSAGLFFDRFHNDQVIGMQYAETPDGYSSMFTIQDRELIDIETVAQRVAAESDDAGRASVIEEELGKAPMRVAIGRDQNGSAAIYLMDSKGKPRILMMVDASDEPTLQFLDAEGNVTFSLPPKD